MNHNPICSCLQGYTGEPFTRCSKIECTSLFLLLWLILQFSYSIFFSKLYLFLFLAPPPPKIAENPCVPSPCGPNSQCRVVGSQPACSCLQNFIGRPPNCRPECINDSECPNNLACKNEKCRDPCTGYCGINAQCIVVNHGPVCSCLPGYIGDPSSSCSLPLPCKQWSNF